VVALNSKDDHATLLLQTGAELTLSRCLQQHVRIGDTVRSFGDPVLELHISRDKNSWPRNLYFCSIGYVTVPKLDRRAEPYLRAEVADGALGVRAVHLPSAAVRDYFYRAERRQKWGAGATLYDVLGVPPDASPAELRLAFRIRVLEASIAESREVERAFNILMTAELRACYDALLNSDDMPSAFPNSGFGRLLVAGDPSSDGQTFFARHILSFAPAQREFRIAVQFRRLNFLPERAHWRDARRRCDVTFDPVLLGLQWDQTWNTWKHLVPGSIDVEASFVQAGRYRCRSGDWQLLTWSTAVPSRINVRVGQELSQQIQTARETYTRFGQYWAAVACARKRLAREPLSEVDLSALCRDYGAPPDFDVAQINWLPDYDPFFYESLRKRARTMYLFRDEYIFECEHLLVVERPQIGHATYLFGKPADLRAFAAAYARTSKRVIRENRDGVAQDLKFVGRVMHGRSPSHWLHQIEVRLGERSPG
jgi:hypothetical protein